MSLKPSRDVTERYQYLDVNVLKRAGALSPPGQLVLWSWHDDDRMIGGMQIQIQDDGIKLNYRIGEWPKSQFIKLDCTPCNFGGERPWFLCPGCSRRSVKLYGGYSGFACRVCQKLVYQSQRENSWQRAERRLDKLKAKLVEDRYGMIDKPVGMHQRTFDRIESEIMDGEAEAYATMARKFGKKRDPAVN